MLLTLSDGCQYSLYAQKNIQVCKQHILTQGIP